MLITTLQDFKRISLRLLHKDPGTEFCHYEEIKVFRQYTHDVRVHIENDSTTACSYINVVDPDTAVYFLEELDYMLEEENLKDFQVESKHNDPTFNSWSLDIEGKNERYSFAGEILNKKHQPTPMYKTLYDLFSSCLAAVKFKPVEITGEKKLARRAAHYAILGAVGKIDESGRDHFFDFTKQVAAALRTDYNAQTVAYLHDAVEYSKILTLEEVYKKFPKPIAAAVDVLIRKPNALYWDYVDEIKKNDLAKIVKMRECFRNASSERTGFNTGHNTQEQRRWFTNKDTYNYLAGKAGIPERILKIQAHYKEKEQKRLNRQKMAQNKGKPPYKKGNNGNYKKNNANRPSPQAQSEAKPEAAVSAIQQEGPKESAET